MPTNSFERGIISKKEKILDQENSQLLHQLLDGLDAQAVAAVEVAGICKKGELQGHIVPIAGCVWDSSKIDMYDLNDSAQCIFHLSDNISTSYDITVVMIYAPRSELTTPTMNLYMALTKTDDTETLSWNYKNAEANNMTLCAGVDWELKRKEWVIPHADFDQNDKLTIYWVNTNAYDYQVHAIILKYTEA